MIDDECQLFCGKNCAENEKCAYDFMGKEICRSITTTRTPTTTEKTCPSKYRLVDGECELFCGLTCAENEKCAYDWKGDEICRQLPTTATPTTTEQSCPSRYKLVDGECKLFCGLSCAEDEKCAYDCSGKEICKKLVKSTSVVLSSTSPCSKECELNEECQFDLIGQQQCVCKKRLYIVNFIFRSEKRKVNNHKKPGYKIIEDKCELFCGLECATGERCRYDWSGKEICSKK